MPLGVVWSQPLQADSGGSVPPSLQQLLMQPGQLLYDRTALLWHTQLGCKSPLPEAFALRMSHLFIKPYKQASLKKRPQLAKYYCNFSKSYCAGESDAQVK